MRRKQAANPINLKGVDVIIANEIASAFIRFKKAWDDHYAWEEGWDERWVAFEAWNPKAVSKLDPEFKELVSNYLYGLSGKTIGDFLRNKNIEFSKDWKVNSIFKSTKIILASYKNFKDGHYFSFNGGKPYVFINPWLIWEGLPRSNSETSFKKLLKNFLGHELVHALDWAYRYKQKEEDMVFEPNKSEQEEAYYNSPHELKAYVYTVADLIWNQTLPMYRAIQSWNGEALYRYVFSDMTGIGDKIKPENRRAFIQRVVKQLEMFKQEWVKERGGKKGKKAHLNLAEVKSGKPLYSSYNGKTTDLDEIIDVELDKGNHVTDKIKSLRGKGLKATWATETLEGAACYIWGRDAVEDGLISKEEMEDEIDTLNLEGWWYDPDMSDGDGGNIYIKPKANMLIKAKMANTLPDSDDLRDALEHMGEYVCSDHEFYEPDDFTYKFYPEYPVNKIPGDRFSWVEVRREDFKGLSLSEAQEELESFRGEEWASRAIGWIKDGDIPPIIIALTPDYEDVADGRGRTNLAIALGLKTIPAWVIETNKSCDDEATTKTSKKANAKTLYYHGTSSEEKGLAILQSGILKPGVSPSPKAKMAPIQGRVYLSKNPAYALMYALGGDMAGGTLPDSIIQRRGRYGYIFAAEEIEADKVIPDEDAVGELIYKHKRKEVTAPSWFIDLANAKLTDNQWYKIVDGDYSTWAQGGKKILKFMTPSQRKEILDFTDHVSHEGELKIAGAWRIDKTRSKEFKRDGSNIFKIAEKVPVKWHSKKAAYSEVDEEFLVREGVDPDEIGWLGGGENGNAYDLGDGRVLKITRSNNEYQKALEIKGKRFSNLIDIYSAEKVGSAYYIIMEDLDMDPQDEALFHETLGVLSTQGIPITYISYFDQEEYEAEYGEISEEVKAFINELEAVVSDLRRAGIGDRADIHADNLGRDKNTGALKAFDLMEKD